MPPLEAWEKVFIDAEAYQGDVHAFIHCVDCHGGQAVQDMSAHTGMIDPGTNSEQTCGSCHPDIAPHAVNSLHTTLKGYDTAIYERSAPEHFEALEYMESYHCSECHATCGDCHISQPASVGGGLLEGHTFVGQPPMSRTCTACHGSRVKNEYYGLNEGIPGDVHLREARLACTDCHSGAEMHGLDAAGEANHRYDGVREPTCESCHAGQVGAGSGILEHEIHGTELLSCQVCHSVSYTNCVNCHVDRTEDDVPYYSVEAHSMGFYIGRNTLRNAERPYRYVPVRHVPVDIDSFDRYGEDLLVNFLNRPTWSYATPHNIQRNTPQTASCTSCHGNDAVFLTPDKVAPEELGGANLDVVVEHAPPLPTHIDINQFMGNLKPTAVPTPSETEGTGTEAEGGEGSESGGDEDFWGSDSGAPADEGETGDEDFWGSDSGAPAQQDEGAPNDEDFWGSDSG